MGSAPASLADNPFLITLLLEMQTTIFLRTEMSRKTEYVHNPCFLSANILKILGVFAENQKKLQQNRSRTCTANPDEYSLHRLHFPSSTGSAPSDPAHRPSAPFRHYKRRRSRSGQADDTPRLTIFHVSHDRHRDLPPNRRRTEKSQTDCPTRNIGTHEG